MRIRSIFAWRGWLSGCVVISAALLQAFVSAPALGQNDLTIGTTRPANPELPGISRAPGARSEPTKTKDYSGVSGPGVAVSGTGLAGYRTGREGVMYKGPFPKEGWLDFGNRAHGDAVTRGLIPPLRPIWDLHLRDTSMCLAEDGNYYMTGSTGDNIWDLNDGVELYRSADLKTWEYLGLVWSVDRDGTWEKKLRYVWAPEIHIVHHNFVITYCMSGGTGGGTGILVSKTGKPEGPYINPVTANKPLTGGIDGSIFEDDDGKVYFTNGAGGALHLMKDDLSGYDGPAITTKAVPTPGGPQRLGHEGVAMFKAHGKYYLSAADTYQGRYSSICGVSEHIEGPYMNVHEAVPCGAGGGYFEDKEGNWWCTYFGNDDQSPWREKPGIVRVDFDKDGGIYLADEQPAFVLQPGASTHWRNKTSTAPTALLETKAILAADTQPAARPPATHPAPFSTAREVYSGISGAGGAVVGDGKGGWRSGPVDLRYDGLDAKPGWKALGEFASTGIAVKQGLIPPLKPIWDLHLRDTVMCVGGDDYYYMTGSSGDNIWDQNDGIELWKSKDFQTWEYVGLVWSFDRDGSWQKAWKNDRGHTIRDIWAPEIHYLKSKHNYYLTFSLAGGGGTGLLVSTTGKPEGPYVNPLKPDARLTGGIDATLFEDDDGKVYITWGRGGQIGLMKDDMSGLDGAVRNIHLDKSDAVGPNGTKEIPSEPGARKEVAMEGATLFKHNGKYYLGGAVFWGGTKGGRYDAVEAMSDNIWGPYTHWHDPVPCGGGTGFFEDHQGNWWCTYFGNDEASPFREKPGMVKVVFDEKGYISIADEQPAFVLQPGSPAKWRAAAGTPAAH